MNLPEPLLGFSHTSLGREDRDSVGFAGVRSEESGACVGVSWTYLNISQRKHSARLRAGLGLQGGEEPPQTDPAAAADRAGDGV